MFHIRQKGLLVLDILLILVSFAGANLLKFGVNEFQQYLTFTDPDIWIVLIIHIFFFVVFEMYNRIWQNAGFIDYLYIVIAFIVSSVASIAAIVIFKQMNYTTLIIFELIFFLLVIAIRFFYRIESRLRSGKSFIRTKDLKRVLIIGAGEAASLVLKEIERRPELNMEVLGLVDDSKDKVGGQVRGYFVMGTTDDLSKIITERGIDEVIFAIPSIGHTEKKYIIEKLAGLKVNVKTVPGVYEMVEQGFNYDSIRDVEIADLLGRQEVQLNMNEIVRYINNKVVMVTGGGGSIGSELCRQIASFNPNKLIILDIYENNAYDIQNELK